MNNKKRRKHISGRKRRKSLSKIWVISAIVAAILIAAIAIAAAYSTKNLGHICDSGSDSYCCDSYSSSLQYEK